ncbi:MAG: peptidase M15 [Oligoflexia bacterium]|nr:peptidase M15 [Oligoflexia bacterium]
MNLSTHFTLEEALFSETAIRKNISNKPSDVQLKNMIEAAKSMEIVRNILGDKSIKVSSWLRVNKLNFVIGGASSSAHINGFAIDFTCPDFGSPYEICKKLSESTLKYDQIIHEFGSWCHISFDPKMRREDLTIFQPRKVYALEILTLDEYKKKV